MVYFVVTSSVARRHTVEYGLLRYSLVPRTSLKCESPKNTCMQKKGFRLEQLFGSKTRARLLGIFLQHPQDFFYVRELTRKIGAQLNSVRRELKNLIDIGLVIASGMLVGTLFTLFVVPTMYTFLAKKHEPLPEVD